MTVEGYVSRDLDIRTTDAGKTVVNVSVPHTPRRLNKQTNEWEDAGATLWVQASLWERDADRVQALGIRKGSLVTLTGEPALREWESNGKSGVNLDLKFATVGLIAHPRDDQQPASASGADGWATSAPGNPGASGGGFFEDPRAEVAF